MGRAVFETLGLFLAPFALFAVYLVFARADFRWRWSTGPAAASRC